MYLLDTNVCARIILGDPVVVEAISARSSFGMATCVMVQGELLYMARNSDRVMANLAAFRAFLETIRVYSLDDETAETYASVKAAIVARWGPRERAKRRQFAPSQLGFSDNDLWIAATALQHDLTLVSDDSDFARITEIAPLRHESWLEAASDAE